MPRCTLLRATSDMTPSPLVCESFAVFCQPSLSKDMLADIPSTKGNSARILGLARSVLWAFWVQSQSPP